MENTNFKIQVVRRPGTILVDIILYTLRQDKIYFYTIGDQGELIQKEAERGVATIDPTISLPEREYRNLLKAFAELSLGEGIETHDSFVKGKLEATERHLEDMRLLALNDKKRIIN